MQRFWWGPNYCPRKVLDIAFTRCLVARSRVPWITFVPWLSRTKRRPGPDKATGRWPMHACMHAWGRMNTTSGTSTRDEQPLGALIHVMPALTLATRQCPHAEYLRGTNPRAPPSPRRPADRLVPPPRGLSLTTTAALTADRIAKQASSINMHACMPTFSPFVFFGGGA